jgi:phage gp29-like protein
MIYRCLFLPSLMGSGEQGGSYSLGQVHFEMFQTAVAWQARVMAENELEQLWRPLIEWNFGVQESYGTLPLVDITTPEEKKAMAETFLNCVNTGFVDPASDADWMREQLGFPSIEDAGGEGRWPGRLPPNLPKDKAEETE